jgi:hypothetical protein
MRQAVTPWRLAVAKGRRTWRKLSTTPGKLRLRSMLIVAGATMLSLSGGATVMSADGTVDRIGHHTELAIIDAQRIHSTLADADRLAADAFLAGSAASIAPYRQYEADIMTASHELEQAAEHNGAGGKATQELEAIIAMTTEYRGLVETARADSRQDFPVGAAYLRRASALMHRPVDGILARVDSLDALSSRDLVEEDSDLAMTAAALVAFALIAIVVFSLLVSLQGFIRRRFRRRWNRPLLGATVLLTVVLGWLIGQSVSSYRSLTIAEQQAFPRVHALWQARSLAADANGNESLSLIARGNGAAFDNAFKAETKQLVSDTLTVDSIDLAAHGQVRFGGLLADEIRSASFSGEREAATAILYAYHAFLFGDGSIRAKATAGDYDGAVALAVGSGPGRLAAAFDDLEAAFDRAITIIQRYSDQAIAAASPSTPLIVGVPLFGISIVILVLWGVRPRIAEYRV